MIVEKNPARVILDGGARGNQVRGLIGDAGIDQNHVLRFREGALHEKRPPVAVGGDGVRCHPRFPALPRRTGVDFLRKV